MSVENQDASQSNDVFQSKENKIVTVFGGSGFLGRHVVRALANQGWRVRVACRRPDLAFFLQPLGKVGQVMPVQANVRFPASVAAAVNGASAVVNLVGVLSGKGAQNFEAVHAFGAKAIAKAAAEAGVQTFAHVSALGADADSSSAYAASKARGEAAVQSLRPDATILRPSVIFGQDDFFFNRFAGIARVLPVLPLPGANTRLQPVYVGDVADALVRAVNGNAQPGVYELGGPEVVTLREIVAYIAQEIERKRLILPVSAGIGKLMALETEIASALTLGVFPQALVTTRDQVELLQHDNVVSEAATAAGRTLQGLGLSAESFRAIAPTYLWRYRRAGQFDRGANRRAQNA